MKKISARVRLAATLFPIVLIIVSCNNGIDPLLPLVNNEVRATISDYGVFDSKDVETVSDAYNYTVKAHLKGGNGLDTLVLTLVIPIQSSGPYSVSVQNDPSAMIDYCVQQTANSCNDFDAKKGLGSGTIGVQSISSGIMQGSFNGSLASASSSETKTITNGEFKVILP